MNIIKASLERPIAIVSVIIMTIILGIVALDRIPIQIAPDVNKPLISVTTYWFGASPYEMEREIVNRQEESLEGLEGVKKVTASTREGRAVIELEFDLTMDMDRALMLVSNRLNQIDDYPDDAGEPTLDTSGLDDNAVAWFILTKTPGNDTNIAAYGDIVEDVVQDRIERVPGVARTNAYGSSETELRITINPEKMAYYGLTVPEVIDIIKQKTSDNYNLVYDVVCASNYGTAQKRKRAIILLSRLDCNIWKIPKKLDYIITVRDMIGDLPTLESQQKSSIHKHHSAKKHNDRHILWMSHTPTGKTAFDNEIYFPQKDGRKIRGFKKRS